MKVVKMGESIKNGEGKIEIMKKGEGESLWNQQ